MKSVVKKLSRNSFGLKKRLSKGDTENFCRSFDEYMRFLEFFFYVRFVIQKAWCLFILWIVKISPSEKG